MSSSTTTDGPSDSDLRTVSRALREIARDADRVTLEELRRETSLDGATIETVMGTIEARKPVRASRIELPGATLAWKLSL